MPWTDTIVTVIYVRSHFITLAFHKSGSIEIYNSLGDYGNDTTVSAIIAQLSHSIRTLMPKLGWDIATPAVDVMPCKRQLEASNDCALYAIWFAACLLKKKSLVEHSLVGDDKDAIPYQYERKAIASEAFLINQPPHHQRRITMQLCFFWSNSHAIRLLLRSHTLPMI